jgi:glycosyltransferase involved in cell wall biosynthesis
MKNLDIEITIPVLNEEDRLQQGVESTIRFLHENELRDWGVVVADNGSDDCTPDIAARLCEAYPDNVRYLRVEQRGVGAAIRSSWTNSNARVVGYMDVDLATDLRHLIDVAHRFQRETVLVVNGSRLLPGSIVRNRSLLRETTSRGLNLIMRFGLDVGFTDAMSGFKFIERGLAIELFDTIPQIPDWFVSAEMLVKAEWRGISIEEIPIHWTDDSRSKADIGQLASQYLRHIKRLRQEKREAGK